MSVTKRFHKLADRHELEFKGGPCGLIALVATAVSCQHLSINTVEADSFLASVCIQILSKWKGHSSTTFHPRQLLGEH